jgi:hypothetical protein
MTIAAVGLTVALHTLRSDVLCCALLVRNNNNNNNNMRVIRYSSVHAASTCDARVVSAAALMSSMPCACVHLPTFHACMRLCAFACLPDLMLLFSQFFHGKQPHS